MMGKVQCIAAAAIAASLLACAGAPVQEVAPADILRQAAAAYGSLETYASEGTATTEFEFGGNKASVETTFAMRLAKPKRYLITWSQKSPLLPGMAQAGAVWSDGTQPYLYLGVMSAYAKMNGDTVALGGATGVSGGVAMTIPSLFLPGLEGMQSVTLRIANPLLVGTERVGDEECFVVGGPSSVSKEETFWISRRDHLIRKYRRSLEPPEGGPQMPEMTDAQADQSLEAMGQERTAENRAQMRDAMKGAMQMMKALPMKGFQTEVHTAVRTPPLGASDFAYAPPAGAALKASLFGDLGGRARQGGAAMKQVNGTLLALEGTKITAQDAEELEKRVAEHPDDVAARTKLVAHYASAHAEEPQRRHVLWLIEHAPESEVLALPYGQLDRKPDSEAYQQGKAAWVAALQKDPQNLKVLGNAAKYFLRRDRELARETLEKARALDPDNPQWPSELGHSWLLQATRARGEPDAAAARTALERYEEAYRLATGSEKDLLPKPLAEAAFAAGDSAKAAEYAGKLLENPGSDWNRGNNIHHGNIILGRIALRSNDVEEAKRRLLAAGRTPGSPQLGSFGPNMALARDLLQRGERETVLQYFDLCAVFWGMGKDKLKAWADEVREGKTPDFGANIVY
jgi:hypothetical protein